MWKMLSESFLPTSQSHNMNEHNIYKESYEQMREATTKAFGVYNTGMDGMTRLKASNIVAVIHADTKEAAKQLAEKMDKNYTYYDIWKIPKEHLNEIERAEAIAKAIKSKKTTKIKFK